MDVSEFPKFQVADETPVRTILEAELGNGQFLQLWVGHDDPEGSEHLAGGHSHQVEEYFEVVKGGGYVLLDGADVRQIEVGDTIEVPSGIGHCFRLRSGSVLSCLRNGPHSEDNAVPVDGLRKRLQSGGN